MSSRAHHVAALALLLCASCGGSTGLDPDRPWGDAGHWHTPPTDRHRGYGIDLHDETQVQLPEADHAEVDRWPPRVDRGTEIRRLRLHVLRSGNTLLRSNEWPWTSEVEAERRAARIALRNELQRLSAYPEMREPQPSPIVAVILRADRRAPWSTVRGVVELLHEPVIGIQHLQWAVYRPGQAFASRSVDHRVSALLLRRTEAPGDAKPLTIRLTVSASGTGAATRLQIGGRAWSFGEAGEGFDDPDFLARANAIWAEVETLLLEAARGASSARVEIVERDHELWWAYVVKVLDLLLGAGLRDVSLPDARARLRLDEPDTTLPAVHADDSVLAPDVVVVCAVAVLLAFALTFLALRRKR